MYHCISIFHPPDQLWPSVTNSDKFNQCSNFQPRTLVTTTLHSAAVGSTSTPQLPGEYFSYSLMKYWIYTIRILYVQLYSRVHRIFFYLIFIRLTLFSLYFLILRTIYFLTFFDLRPPSFANFNFCLLMGIRRNFNGKIIRFLIPCRNMVYIWSIWF